MNSPPSRRLRKLRNFSPKLFPFVAVEGLCLILHAPLDLVIDLKSRMPSNVYDVRMIDGIKFGTRLFRDGPVRDEMDEEAFLNVKPREGDTVLDVGANIGSYTLRYSKLVGETGRVFAFEPVPENRRILLWNLRLNEVRNVTARPEAVSDSDGVVTMNLSRGPSAESIVREFHKSGELQVKTVTIDSLQLSKLDLVKIDVEGAELSVLKGAARTIKEYRPRMQIEVHSAHDERCGPCNWLEDMGYSVRLIHQKYAGAGQIHWIDAANPSLLRSP